MVIDESPSHWDECLTELRSEWLGEIEALRQRKLDLWAAGLETVSHDYFELRAKGIWQTGPVDLLNVIGQAWQETYHSAAIAWLMDPGRHHGLGFMFLEQVLTACFPDERFSHLYAARAQTEVIRGRGRIDIMVKAPGLTLVIENKVGAPEGTGQCDYYYEQCSGEPGARFVFLSPGGRAPTSATGDAELAYRPLSYIRLADCLRQALQLSPDNARGRAAAEQYLLTLDEEFGESNMQRINDEKIRFYLRHQELIDEWAELASLARQASHDFLVSCADSFEEAKGTLEDGVVLTACLDDSWPSYYLRRPDWPHIGSHPELGVAFQWSRNSVTLAGANRPYVGIRTDQGVPLVQDVRRHVLEAAKDTNLKSRYPNNTTAWWCVWRNVEPPAGAFWDDLAPYRDQLTQAFVDAWHDLSPLLDQAMRRWRNEADHQYGLPEQRASELSS